MRVAINCRSFSLKRYTGIGRYTYNLVKSLSHIDTTNEYWLYLKKNLWDLKRTIPLEPTANFIHKINNTNRRLSTFLEDVDVYHSPSLGFFDDYSGKVVVTIHDLIHKTFARGHTDDALSTIEMQVNEAVEKAQKIICCSQSTINDLRKYYRVDPEKVRLVYQGVDKAIFRPFNTEELNQARRLVASKGIDGRFILNVGTIEPRKNLKNLIKAFGVLKEKKYFDGKLVIAGLKGWMMEEFDAWLQEQPAAKDCIFVGYLSDPELSCFYNTAELFAFPSFYEGFGFPILEAMSCATAVVTSNISSCPEIAGEGAFTVDPSIPESIVMGLRSVLEEGPFKTRLKERALERSKMFSFRNTAEETLEVYQAVANS